MPASKCLLEVRLNPSSPRDSSDAEAEQEMRPRPLIRGFILSDFANPIALMYQDNPNTSNRSYKLVCNYLFDAQRFSNFSYVDAPYNLSDVGAKVNSNVVAWRNWARSNCFYIGPMGRKEYKLPSVKMTARL